jgi:hypothetical protein
MHILPLEHKYPNAQFNQENNTRLT